MVEVDAAIGRTGADADAGNGLSGIRRSNAPNVSVSDSVVGLGVRPPVLPRGGSRSEPEKGVLRTRAKFGGGGRGSLTGMKRPELPTGM